MNTRMDVTIKDDDIKDLMSLLRSDNLTITLHVDDTIKYNFKVLKFIEISELQDETMISILLKIEASKKMFNKIYYEHASHIELKNTLGKYIKSSVYDTSELAEYILK